MDENLSYLVTTLPNVMLIGLTEVEIKRFFSHDITWPHYQIDICLSKKEPLKLSCHYAKFDASRSCGSGDMTWLFCQVTSRDHMIKGPFDFLSLSSSP